MRHWEFTLALDGARAQPLFLQLATAIAGDIRAKRLRAGDALPGSRALARQLRMNRNTVVAAYAELAAEGLVDTRLGAGTFVAADAARALRPAPRYGAAPMQPTYPLAEATAPAPWHAAPAHGVLNLALGVTDARLFPGRALARALRRAIGARSRETLMAADPAGHPRLRRELAAMLARSRALAATPQNLLVTRSIEQAIDLVARTLLRPADVVVVEALGYPPAWNILRLAGAELVALPLDDDGLDVAQLEILLARRSIRAVFLTPHHQFPTASVMSAARRRRLGELALQHRFAILEDDYDHEFHYDGKPVLPIAAGPCAANVVYLGSLANLLAPGLGAGFVIAPPPLCDALRSRRAAIDPRGEPAVECAIAELLEDGELLRHARRLRRAWAARRDALADALARQLGAALSFRLPAGGGAIWARVDSGIDVPGWAQAGAREGVFFHNAQPFDFFGREQPFLRLNFCALDAAELEEAARRMARALACSRRLHRTAAAAPARTVFDRAAAQPPAALAPRPRAGAG